MASDGGTSLMREDELKAAGNGLFREGKLAPAAAQYYAALAVSHACVCILLQNLSTAYLQRDQAELALVHAAAAISLSDGAPPAKACFKAARAAQSLGMADAARVALAQVPAEQRTPAIDKLQAALGPGGANCEALAKAVVHASQALKHAPPHASAAEASAGQPGVDAAAAYREGRVQDAIAAWRTELLQHSVAPAVLGNLAQVQLRQERWAAAAGSASAALVWDPASVKSWYRQAQAAAEARWAGEALGFCQRALQIEPGNAPLKALKRKLSAATAAAATAAAATATAASRHNPGRVLHEIETGGHETLETLDLMQQMMERRMASCPDMLRECVRCAGPPPPRLEELLSVAVLPQGCRMQACRSKLRKTSADAFAWWMKVVGSRTEGRGDLDDPLAISSGTLIKRLQSNHPSRLAWWRSSAPGAVDTSAGVRGDFHNWYDQLLPYANTAQHPVPMRASGVHVVVGFGDLGELAASLVESAAGGGARDSGAGTVLQWVGYDASAYACARVDVITCMLRQNASVDAVAQVWYSCAWDGEAHAAFCSALKEVAQDASQPATLRAWYKDWTDADVTLHRARTEHLHRRVQNVASVIALLKHEDQLQLVQQVLSGDVCVASPVSGNVTFFTQPSGARHSTWSLDDSFFHTVPADTLAKARQATGSFVAAGEQVVRCRIAALRNAVQSSTVTIQACSSTCSSFQDDPACVGMFAV